MSIEKDIKEVLEDIENDQLWNYFPTPKIFKKKKDDEGDYYEIEDTWGVR